MPVQKTNIYFYNLIIKFKDDSNVMDEVKLPQKYEEILAEAYNDSVSWADEKLLRDM